MVKKNSIGGEAGAVIIENAFSGISILVTNSESVAVQIDTIDGNKKNLKVRLCGDILTFLQERTRYFIVRAFKSHKVHCTYYFCSTYNFRPSLGRVAATAADTDRTGGAAVRPSSSVVRTCVAPVVQQVETSARDPSADASNSTTRDEGRSSSS